MDTDTPATEPATFETTDDAAAALRAMFDAEEATEEKKEEEPAKEPEPEAEDNAQDEGADAPITVTVDGKQVTLTKEQIAEAYKSGLRQDDYSRKTQTLAEQRKATEAEVAKTHQERAEYAQNLSKMAAQLEGALEQQSKIDWNDLREKDPHEFLRQWHLQTQRQAALEQNRQEQTSLANKVRAEQTEALKGHLAKQQDELLAKLPEWKDEAKANSERDAIKSHLVALGYTPEDVKGISDHRAVIVARESMLYRQLMAQANAASKKVEKAPQKVLQPGVASERTGLDGRTAAVKQFMKSGSLDDMSAVWRTLI